MNNIPTSSNTPQYVRKCTFSELTNIQIEIEKLMIDWYEDDIKLNFSTLAIIEVLANIFEHGADSLEQSTLHVELSISRHNDLVTALIEDNTSPIPDEAILTMTGTKTHMPATDVSQDKLPVSGWGLNLVQHATKSVNYERKAQLNYLELIFCCGTTS